jgi:Peptidase family M28
MARQVAESDGVSVQADPQHIRNVFVRSDQYSFIRHGIPALALDIAPTTPEEQKTYADWLTHRYHAPSDDLDQPVDLASAGKYEEIIRQLMVKVANDPQRPQWKTDSFFRRFADTTKTESDFGVLSATIARCRKRVAFLFKVSGGKGRREGATQSGQ